MRMKERSAIVRVLVWAMVSGLAGAGCVSELGPIPAVDADPEGGGGGGGGGSGTCGVDEFATADGEGAGPTFSLEVDTSAIDPFVVGAPATVPIAGSVNASAGLAGVDVGGVPAVVEGSNFAAEVPVTPGLVKVPIVARDAAGHERVGNRALLSATFLPEGATNVDAAALVLDDEILAAMIEPYVQEVADIDMAQQIRDQAGNLDQQGCEMNLDRVSTGQADIRMYVGQGGTMNFDFTVPDVDVTFSGECNMFISSATFNGRLQTDVVVTTSIFVPYTGACADTPDHTYPTVDLPGYNLDLNIQSGGGGGGLMDMMMPIIEGIMQGVVRDQLATQIAEQADGLIAEQTSQFAAFDAANAFAFAETDIEVGFCLTELGPADGLLRARVGLSAQGPGHSEAPGAPLAPGELPPAGPGSLWVDANLIGQFMYSLWTAGTFHREVEGMLTVGTIALVAPDLGERYCDDTPVTIAINGVIPPYVHAADPGAGDLVVELGDLQIDLVVEGELLLGLGANVVVTLELTPQGTALLPEVVGLEVESYVRSEPMADVPDELVLGFVDTQFGEQVDALLGDGGFELPALGGMVLTPTDVVAEPGGRFMRVSLAP